MKRDGGFQAPSRWGAQDVAGLLLLLVTGVWATADAWREMLQIALGDEEQSHICLVPLITAWLVWVRRGRLRRLPRDGRMIGPVVVAIGWVLYSAGDLLLIEAAWHLGAITVAVGCFLSFAGSRYLAQLAPAFLALLFMVPVPGMVRLEIAVPLQTATASVTQRVFDVLGVDVVQSGNALAVNGKSILVAEACNGLRMVFALFLVSYTFAYSTPIREPVRLLIVALSPITAILCNVIRLVPTVWIYAFVSEGAGTTVHDVGAWLMLPIAFLLLLGVFRLLRWALVPVYRFTLAYGR